MAPFETLPLSALYLDDETAWLDRMAECAQAGQVSELDLPNLAEFLADMARRDRREVESRLAVLLAHMLKWLYQPEQRSGSWRGTLVEQRQELARLASRGTLRVHAENVLSDSYHEGLERAVAETGMAAEKFPKECPFTLDELFAFDPN